MNEERTIGELITPDNKKISFNHINNDHADIIIVAHGFYNNKGTLLFQKIAQEFSEKYDVIVFDFRGHGQSDGLFTWTSEEAQDLRLMVSYAKEQGYRRVGVIGFSLGAAITLIEGAANRDIDSIISVSAPYDFWKINYRFWEEGMLEDLKLNLGPKGKGKGIRPGSPFLNKVRPIDIVGNIAPTPVLFLHGKDDWLIKSSHSDKLFKKAKDPKAIEI
ncbi:MAG: alpha/beta fold hydrolase, partial [Candidatus Heimdallarchaeota archaeon]|nr:alpha/beta fold hydrolase [Candidatus Heimdallarchaeota archaeon]